jgi:hypothetical protein
MTTGAWSTPAGSMGWLPSGRYWDSPTVDWRVPRLVVVRSTWDYTYRRSEFLFSHAVRKGPMLQEPAVHQLADPRAAPSVVEDRFLTEQIEARDPSADEMAVAGRALAAIPGGVAPLYARVDLLPTSEGPVVTELELIEPSLFFGHAPGAPRRMAQAIASRLAGL